MSTAPPELEGQHVKYIIEGNKHFKNMLLSNLRKKTVARQGTSWAITTWKITTTWKIITTWKIEVRPNLSSRYKYGLATIPALTIGFFRPSLTVKIFRMKNGIGTGSLSPRTFNEKQQSRSLEANPWHGKFPLVIHHSGIGYFLEVALVEMLRHKYCPWRWENTDGSFGTSTTSPGRKTSNYSTYSTPGFVRFGEITLSKAKQVEFKSQVLA